jgi:integrase
MKFQSFFLLEISSKLPQEKAMAKRVEEIWDGEYIHQGERKVCRFRITKRKKEAYLVFRMQASPKGQNRLDVTRHTIEELKEIYRDWQSANRPGGDTLEHKLTRLSDQQIKDAENAVRMLPEGLNLEDAVSMAKPIFSAKRITLADAYKEYVSLKERTDENRDGGWASDKTKIEFENVMKWPRIRFGQRLVSSICAEELKPYWDKGNRQLGGKGKKPISDQTRKNRYKVIQKFFKWCHDQKYHHEHILGEDQIASPKVKKSERPAPDIINNVTVRLIFEECKNSRKYAGWIPFMGLLFFAGLRTGEIHGGQLDAKKKDRSKCKPLTWDNVHLAPEFEDPYIQLPFTGKMRSNRIVKLPPNLVKLLKLSKENGDDIFSSKITSQTYRTFREKVGLKERKANSPRHTAISNWYRCNPLTQKPATSEELTDQFGNSEETRAEFYVNTQGIGIKSATKYWKTTDKWKRL